MDAQKLQMLLSREEGPKLDFKLELNLDSGSAKRELAKDVSAIANSRGGRGYMLFGIEDKTKKVVGINPDDFKEEKIQQIITTRCEPPIPISVETVPFLGKYVAIITIYSGEQKPYQFREAGSFYIRRGSTTDLMRKEELASILQDSGLLSYELTPVIKAGVDSLDMESVRAYTSKAGMPLKGQNLDILENLGILIRDREYGEYHPSAGGLLLFGYNPQLYLPHCSIRVVNRINSRCKNVEVFTGPLIAMVDRAEGFISDVLSDGSYPVGAIYEAIENAAAYRDYFDVFHEITVLILKGSIHVISPGSLMGGAGVISGSNLPVRRNMWLYQRLMAVDEKNRFLQTGLGFKRMRQAFKGRGRVRFINVEDRNLFKVIFPGLEILK